MGQKAVRMGEVTGHVYNAALGRALGQRAEEAAEGLPPQAQIDPVHALPVQTGAPVVFSVPLLDGQHIDAPLQLPAGVIEDAPLPQLETRMVPSRVSRQY